MHLFTSTKRTEAFTDGNESIYPYRSSKVTGGQKRSHEVKNLGKSTMTLLNAFFHMISYMLQHKHEIWNFDLGGH